MHPPTTAQEVLRSTRPLPFLRLVLRCAVPAAAMTTALVLLADFVRPPATVDPITIENPSRYSLGIRATGADRDGWVPVGTVHRGTTQTFHEVLDQGDVWIFHFTSQLRDGGELRVTRRALEASGWWLVIPESVGAQLEAKGAPFPP